MTDQATHTVDGGGAVTGTGSTGAPAHGTTSTHSEHNPGRPISWFGTSTVIVGFVIGGIAFPVSDPGPNWLLFWLGTAIALIGCFVLLFAKSMATDWY